MKKKINMSRVAWDAQILLFSIFLGTCCGQTVETVPPATVPPTPFVTSEDGTKVATIGLRLSQAPTASVTVSFFSDGEGNIVSPSPSEFTFTTGNWDTPQVITVEGQQDAIADGDTTYNIRFNRIAAPGSGFDGVQPDAIPMLNEDEDVPAVIISATTLSTSEDITTAQYTVVLSTQPTADVTIEVTSGSPNEGTVDPARLVFTAGPTTGTGSQSNQWRIPQEVTVTGVDDRIADGPVVYDVTHTVMSTDTKYSVLTPASVSVTNEDNDVESIILRPVRGVWNMDVSEEGTTKSFTAELGTIPAADVTITFTSNDTTEAVVSGPVTFTPAEWNVPKVLVITGVNDEEDDGDIPFSIVGQGSANYDVQSEPVVGVNQDNDVAAILVSKTALTTSEGATTDTFSVSLQTKPTQDVEIRLIVSDLTEGMIDASQMPLTFTTTDWNTLKPVTVTGVDDEIADGPVSFTVSFEPAVSSDPQYSGLVGPEVSINNLDNDRAGVIVSSISGNTSESGDTAEFTIVLQSKPRQDVTVLVSSGDRQEGVLWTPQRGGMNDDVLRFTPDNWNTAQTVTVKGVDDTIADGDVRYSIITDSVQSLDSAYNGTFDPPNPALHNIDDDVAGVVLTDSTGTELDLNVPLLTSEQQSIAPTTFLVRLSSEPTETVRVRMFSLDLSEGELSAPYLDFAPGSWSAAQTVTVTGIQDSIDDGDVTYNISFVLESMDPTGYANMMLRNLMVTNVDDDTVGITVSPTGRQLLTSEDGATDTFSVVLHTRPEADVVIRIESDNRAEGDVSPSVITFLPGGCRTPQCPGGRSHWSVPQVVTVTGIDDLYADGDKMYNLILHTPDTLDAKYRALNPSDLEVINQDNDVASIHVVPVSPLAPLNTREADRTPIGFLVSLVTTPLSHVNVSTSSNNTAEGSVLQPTLFFSPDNWNISQRVDVVGVDDPFVDGNRQFEVTFIANSADIDYENVSTQAVLVNLDDDTAEIITEAASEPLYTSETGDIATFRVYLTSAPASDVVVILDSTDRSEGTLQPTVVRFDSTSWRTGVNVSVRGEDDLEADGDVAFQVIVRSTVSNDAAYNNQSARPVPFVNRDNDTALIELTPLLEAGQSQLVVTENGNQTARFTVVLQSMPTADVVIPLLTSDATEGQLIPLQLTFTPANWSFAQTVTVMGVDDNTDDGDVVFSVSTARAISLDATYDGRVSETLLITSLNDDSLRGSVCVRQVDTSSPGMVPCSCCDGTTTEDGTMYVEIVVVLNIRPAEIVRIDVTSNDTSEGTTSTSVLEFSPGTWNAEQTITVRGTQDAVDDDTVPYRVILSPAASNDASFRGFDLPDITLMSEDDDTAGVTVLPTTLLLQESGRDGMFTIELHTQPLADVVVSIVISDPTEVSVDKLQLVFTPDIVSGRHADVLQNNSGRIHWATPQVVTVMVIDDPVDDGNKSLSISMTMTSSDEKYNGLISSPVQVTTTDDDTAGVIVSPRESLFTTEQGGTATFRVRLGSKPQGNVQIPVQSNNTAEGLSSLSRLVFTPDNWNVEQEVTVSGVAGGGTAREDVAYAVNLGPTSSTDPQYNGMSSTPVNLLNVHVPQTPQVPQDQTCNYANLTVPTGAQGCPRNGVAPVGAECVYTAGSVVCERTRCLASGVWSVTVPTCEATSGCGSFSAVCALVASPTCAASACTTAECCVGCGTFSCPSGRANLPSSTCAPSGCSVEVCCAAAGGEDDDGGFPWWAGLLIGLGGALCCSLLLLALWLCTRDRKTTGKEEEAPNQPQPQRQQPQPPQRRPEQARQKTPPSVLDTPRHMSKQPEFVGIQEVPMQEEEVQDEGGQRFIARWSRSREQYYYYPEGASGTEEAVWELPADGYVVTWKGGPEDAQGGHSFAPSHQRPSRPHSQLFGAAAAGGGDDPYSVTPLPASARNQNPIEKFDAAAHRYSSAT